jgi:hypothetical protein
MRDRSDYRCNIRNTLHRRRPNIEGDRLALMPDQVIPLGPRHAENRSLFDPSPVEEQTRRVSHRWCRLTCRSPASAAGASRVQQQVRRLCHRTRRGFRSPFSGLRETAQG